MAWTCVAQTAALQDDDVLPLVLGGKEVALFRVEGEFFATSNVCTHQYALLSDGFCENGQVECPLHQASFDIRTGEAQCAPAREPLRIYPVKVEGDDVLVEHE
ncbi:MAG: non-heme iron oxygenase ferredoxin subunit [Polaromonas sp.]|nr:non-heme iron oxygenase ferredoxin subunit [Polaromonas sp.]